MKGIVLAGGAGTRLHPVTKGISKQLIPVYDKPMIYYPLSVQLLAGIKDILIISTKEDLPQFKRLLGDGSSLGIRLSYAVQDKPNGIAEAFIIGKDFIGSDPCCLILGDNFFYGSGLVEKLQNVTRDLKGARIFAKWVNNPTEFGVVEFNEEKKVLSVEEKPKKPRSNYAITGLYFYDNQICDIAKEIKPSARGELEITEINEHYLRNGELHLELLGRGFAWLDTGTHTGLLEASNFVHAVESRQGLKIACLEEISYEMGNIELETLLAEAEKLSKSDYGRYMLQRYS